MEPTYRIDLNTTPGFYFSFLVFDPRLQHKKRLKLCFHYLIMMPFAIVFEILSGSLFAVSIIFISAVRLAHKKVLHYFLLEELNDYFDLLTCPNIAIFVPP